jgi:RND family efflux transporter MFP subunit
MIWRMGIVAAVMAWPVQGAALDVISCLLEPSRAFSIGSPVQGIVQEVPVERGDQVAKGDVLLRIDARMEEAQLATAQFNAESQAVIESRKAQLELATKMFEQAEDLSKRGVAARNQLEEMRTQMFVAQAELREAEDARLSAGLQVQSALAALEQRVIRAPEDAVVVERLTDTGELASTGRPLFELVSVQVLHAEVLAPARDYGQIELGQSWQVSSENTDLVRTGTVTAIDPVIDAASRSFGFRIAIENADRALTAGNRCDLAQ